MTKLIVDGKEIEVPPESTLLQACEAAGAVCRWSALQGTLLLTDWIW